MSFPLLYNLLGGYLTTSFFSIILLKSQVPFCDLSLFPSYAFQKYFPHNFYINKQKLCIALFYSLKEP